MAVERQRQINRDALRSCGGVLVSQLRSLQIVELIRFAASPLHQSLVPCTPYRRTSRPTGQPNPGQRGAFFRLIQTMRIA